MLKTNLQRTDLAMFFITTCGYLKTSVNKCSTSVDSSDGVKKTVNMSDQKVKFYELFDKYYSENEKKKTKIINQDLFDKVLNAI